MCSTVIYFKVSNRRVSSHLNPVPVLHDDVVLSSGGSGIIVVTVKVVDLVSFTSS